jgi:gamma-glutamyltranspeptidase/glutathione hydrolase
MALRWWVPVLLALGLAAQERSQSGLDFEGDRPMVNQPERASRAMVTTTHELATRAGLDILRQGGNAIDAAVAVGFVLAVVHPEAGNLGGGGYLVVRMSDGRMRAFDYKETVPAAARLDGFPDSQRPYVGHRTAGVPGTVAGLALAHQRFGRLPWSAVLEPARRLARDGFPASQRMELVLRLQVPVMKQFPEAARLFLHGGDQPLKQGELLRQPDLAATIRRLQRSGWREFYEGETARRIAADMAASGGFLTAADLAGYKAHERDPLCGTYRGHQLCTIPPSSSGGFPLLETLNILEHLPMRLGMEGSVESRHYLAEAMRRAYRDRSLYAADPAFRPVPLERLLDKAYAARLAASIRPDRASRNSELPALEAAAGPSGGLDFEPAHTTHYSIVDAAGNLVANTYTLGSFYGSQVVARGTGVLLGDMVGTLAMAAKRAAAGAGEGGIGTLTPGARMASTMAPVVAMRPGGSPYFALGTPGGGTITNTLVQVIVNLIDYKMSLRDAIEYPRIHHGYTPDRIEAEPAALVYDVAARLQQMGHTIAPRLRTQGDVHAVLIEEKTGMRVGWSDGRRGGRAAGY